MSAATPPGVDATALPAWHTLARLAGELLPLELPELCARPTRFDTLSFRAGALLLDLSKQRLNAAVLAAFEQLTIDAGLPERRAALFVDNQLNATEQRAVLHTALRAPAEAQPESVRAEIQSTLTRMQELTGEVRSGQWRGFTGKSITAIVHIGIGGSWLGPELIIDALADRHEHGPHVHFLANIDGTELARLLPQLNPERTLFIVASKSFSTIETLINARSLRAWMMERGASHADLARHFIAVSSNVRAAVEFGIAADNILPMWDWVGGRYSIWSAIGLVVALRYGWSAFTDLLAGARELDEHFRTAPQPRNLPVLLACSELWNLHFLGADSHVVLTYDHRLKKLPAYLQQLEMESNGKRVRIDGEPVGQHTAPITWGGEGTNGQHSFHQLLHQGTRTGSIEFVLTLTAPHHRTEHQRWLLANALAQSEALLKGQAAADPQRAVPGGHGSSTIVIDELTPRSLGALLALYEHKVFVQGVIWGINSFDQFGVELGKQLAVTIEREIVDGRIEGRHDASTTGLIAHVRNHLQQ